MFLKKKKSFLIFLSLLLLFACFSLVYALEIEYPAVKGQQPPKEATDFPEYVKYIFNFSIIITGVVAFWVLVSSGFTILTSPDQTETIKSAKNKMIGAFVGIVFLLGSYLLLTTINPNFFSLSLNPLKPATGIYLYNSKGEKDYIPQSTPKITFDANTLEFLSTKDELSVVFAYTGENYQGSWLRIENTKSSQDETLKAGVFSPKSIYFVWNKPGVYLYPETDFKGRPIYVNSNTLNLSNFDFNDKAKSIQFKSSGNDNYYAAVLFTDNGFQGKCGFTWQSNTSNLSSPEAGNYRPATSPIGINTLSSLVVSNFTMAMGGAEVQKAGKVAFYDDIDCKGNSYTVDVYSDGPKIVGEGDISNILFEKSKKPIYENILSFRVLDGKAGVVLTTESGLKGKCQYFANPGGDGCVPTLIGTPILSDIPFVREAIGEERLLPERVRSILIFPE
jgi:hypothetical protein